MKKKSSFEKEKKMWKQQEEKTINQQKKKLEELSEKEMEEQLKTMDKEINDSKKHWSNSSKKEICKRIHKYKLASGIREEKKTLLIIKTEKEMEEYIEKNRDIVTKIYNKYKNPREKGYEKKNTNQKYQVITINPPELSTEKILEISKIIEKKDYLDIMSYVVEQRGENLNTSGEGKHLHILIKQCEKYDSYNLIRIIQKSLNKYCPNKECIHITLKKEPEKPFIIQYFLGFKKEEKMKKVKVNKLWREYNGIKQIYIINDDPKLYKQEEIKKEYINNVNIVKQGEDLTIYDEKNDKIIYAKIIKEVKKSEEMMEQMELDLIKMKLDLNALNIVIKKTANKYKDVCIEYLGQ